MIVSYMRSWTGAGEGVSALLSLRVMRTYLVPVRERCSHGIPGPGIRARAELRLLVTVHYDISRSRFR